MGFAQGINVVDDKDWFVGDGRDPLLVALMYLS